MSLSYLSVNIPPTWPIDMFIREMIFLCYYASTAVGRFSNKCETFQLKKKKERIKQLRYSWAITGQVIFKDAGD